MKEMTSTNETTAHIPLSGRKIIALAAIALLVIAAGFLAYRAFSGGQAAEPAATGAVSEEGEAAGASEASGQAMAPAVARTISEAELEAAYGLRVRLLAVTAGGGMIDLRLKVVDAEKAAQLLGPGQALPRLVVEESGFTIPAPPVEQELKLEDGLIVFGLYPNSQHAIDPGAAVSVQFGSLLLEPVIAQ